MPSKPGAARGAVPRDLGVDRHPIADQGKPNSAAGLSMSTASRSVASGSQASSPARIVG